MTRPAITPVPRERPFGIDELFFSTTDRKGVIRSGNDVFVRVSGYPREELIGRAHNIIRHPDMPRAVFELFWREIGAGRPVAAYVKNMAADGAYYWVMASAVPVDDGYLSIRTKPTGPLLEAAKAIYADVLAVEREVEGDDPRMRKAAIAAGLARLEELLAEAGFPDYAAFERAMVPDEVMRRDALIGRAAHERLADIPLASGGALVDVLGATTNGHRRLDGFVGNLAAYADLSRQLASKSDFIRSLADDIRLFSLNAMLAAARLGDEGASLGAVAEILRSCSDDAGPVIAGLDAEISNAVTGLGDLALRVATSKLQAEAMMVFAHALLWDEGSGADVRGDMVSLAHALRGGVAGMITAFDELGVHLTALSRHATAMDRNLKVMRALEVNGRIEAVRTQGDAVQALFRSIAEQVALARDEMAEFDGVRHITARRDRMAERQLAADVDAVDRGVEALADAA